MRTGRERPARITNTDGSDGQWRIAIVAFVAFTCLALTPLRSFAQTVSFGPATNFAVSGGTVNPQIGPFSVVIGDFNEDGKPDLATANGSNTLVNVLLGTSTPGSFVPAGGSPINVGGTIGIAPNSIVVGDFNRDGHLDLAVELTETITDPNTGAQSFISGVAVLLGDGTGAFGPPTLFPGGSNPNSIAIGDLNGDGKLDLVIANYQFGTVSVLLGNGDGTFGPATDFPVPSGTTAPYGQAFSASLGDLNGDGKLDVVVANNTTGVGAISVLLGNGTGGFGPGTTYSPTYSVPQGPGGGGVRFVAIGDVNGDGIPDLVTSNILSNTVSVLLGGAGTFGGATSFAVGSGPNFVAISDLNGDGMLDLAVANAGGNSISVLLGDCSGSFTTASGSPFAVGTGPNSVAIGDFNQDGKLDMVSANENSNNVSVLLNTTAIAAVVCDRVAPTTVASGTPSANAAGWNNSNVTVMLTATDNPGGSGVQSITYTLTGAQVDSGSIAANSTSILITVEGVTTVTFHARDNAGNVEVDHSITVRLDKTPPTLTFGTATPSPNPAGWNNTTVSVPFTAADALSGVASTSPATSPLVLTSEGTAVSGTVTVTDVAGNSATFTSAAFQIDKTPPTLTFGTTTPAPNPAGWNRTTPVTIPFTPSDALSGVASTSLSSPLAFTTETAGATQNVMVTDVAGNSATFASRLIKIDKTPPTLTFGPALPAPNAAGWNNTNVSVPFTATDSLSGVASTLPALSPLVLTAEGVAVTGNVTVTDVAGNSPTFTSASFKIDKIAPTTSITSNPPAATSTGSASFSFAGADNLTPAINLSFRCQLDSSVLAACTSPVSYTGLTQGTHTFHVQTVDLAGNMDPTGATKTWQVATFSLLYSGQQIVNLASTNPLALTAQFSTTATVCLPNELVSFALDSSPLSGASGTYLLGTASTTSNGSYGLASQSVLTANWLEGVYAITAASSGTTPCNYAVQDSAILTVASPGDSATGGGWYNLSGSGRINFGFTVHLVPNTTNTYTGQLLLINNGKWRLKGTLATYVKTGSNGAASGTGNLFYWDATLNNGLGGWTLAQNNVSYTISFADTSTGGQTDTFGIQINYRPQSPPQPNTLPNSVPVTLKGGNIQIH